MIDDLLEKQRYGDLQRRTKNRQRQGDRLPQSPTIRQGTKMNIYEVVLRQRRNVKRKKLRLVDKHQVEYMVGLHHSLVCPLHAA